MENDSLVSNGRSFRLVRTILKLALIALCIVVPFRYFVAQPFIVSGASMEPTLNKGDYLVIDKLSLRTSKPERGDVIIFSYPLDPAVFFVKRIIGLPGEAIEIRDGDVYVHANGTTTRLVEPYLVRDEEKKSMHKLTLDAGEYFVMGDNRDASADSRTWGPLQDRYLVGRAWARILPFSEAAFTPGVYRFSAVPSPSNLSTAE